MKPTTQSQYDKMTKTPIPNLIIGLSIPTVLSMLVTNIYNMVDTAFVGKLGTSASGAVGIVFGFMSILQAAGFMFGQGAGSMIARKLGAKDNESASRIASTAFFLCFGVGILMMAASFIYLDKLVFLLGSTETIAPYAKEYISYIILAAPFLMSSLVLNNILRYEGKAALGTIGMMTGSVLNMVGDPIFMFALKMGVSGAGLSTALSQIVSFFILLSMYLRGKTQSKLSIRKISGDFSEIFEIMATGSPSLFRQGLNSASTIMLNSCAKVYGDVAVAAMSIVSRIIMFIFSVVIGVGQGFQPVAGFNYGAKKYKRVRAAYKYTFIFSEILLLITSTIVLLKSGSVIRIFRDDEAVITMGTRALKLQMATMLFNPVCVCTEMLMQCTGKKLNALILSSLRSGIYFIPCLYLLARFRGMYGIEEAQPLAFFLASITSAVFAYFFFKGFPLEDMAEERL